MTLEANDHIFAGSNCIFDAVNRSERVWKGHIRWEVGMAAFENPDLVDSVGEKKSVEHRDDV